METLLEALGLIVATVLLWTGLRKVELGRFHKTVLSILDLLVLVAAIARLGWLGAGLFAAANVVAILVSGVRLAVRLEDRLVYAATQAGTTKEEMQSLHKELYRSSKSFKLLGQQRTADLISYLSERARRPEEIRVMADPIAKLWVVFRPELDALVERFDRVLRLYGKSASDSLQVADTLTKGTQLAAATFEEMLDAMIAAVEVGN